MQQALMLVDIQNDYFPGGAMELVGSSEAGQRAGRLLQVSRRKALPIIHMQHVATRPDASFFRPDTPGVAIHSSVAPLPEEIVMQKHFPNSFRETPLLEYLQQHGITQLVIAGMMTHMCIDTTTRAAADLGFQCILAYDACATKSLIFGEVAVAAAQVQAAYLAALDGLFARVLAVDAVCAML